MRTETIHSDQSQQLPEKKVAGGNLNPIQLRQTVFGYAPVIMLDAAIRLGVFDALSSGPLTSAEVAQRCQTSMRGTRPLLDALASLEFLKKHDGCYSLTPESAVFLVKTSPTFFGGFIHHNVHNLMSSWQQLEDVVRTGKPAKSLDTEKQGGAFFREFVPALFALSQAAARVLAEGILRERGSGPLKVLDVGAGSAVFGIAFAIANLNAQVTAADWKAVLEVARDIALQSNVLDRFSFVEGDLFESDFGSGFDVATLGNILHMEGPERCRTLLRKVYEALAPGGTIAIVEYVPDDDRTGQPMHLIFAVNMLVNTAEGDTYTFPEIREWLVEAGFENVRRVDTPSPSPAILAAKPGVRGSLSGGPT
jgi:ubiquinone/menaquinone biosynthesis C-methylase UbiE